jgi:carbamoylphosphate synthase small subunit
MKNFIMAYTVVSVFPVTVDTEEIKKSLRENGFQEANIIVSKSKLENESSAGDYRDDVTTRNFWDFVFAHDTEMLEAYSRESVGKNNIIVYADNLQEAQKANDVLNANGAVKVYKKQQEEPHAPAGMSEEVYNGIIAKAKHDIYFLGSERVYHSNEGRGMNDEMDSQGSKD